MINYTCFMCANYMGYGMCHAFPKAEIPKEILLGDNDHSKPLPDQGNEIIFEPIEK